MPTLQWTGRSQFSYEGTMYAPGETDEFDDDEADELLDHWSDGWERADDSDSSDDGDSDSDADNADGDETEAPFDPSEETNDSLDEMLSENDYSEAELNALLEAEEAGKDRDGAKEALNDALDEA